MRESRCKRCKELIVWAQSAKTQQWMPLDPVPTFDGNVEVKRGKVSETDWCRVLTPDEQGNRRLYMAHYVTCGRRKK